MSSGDADFLVHQLDNGLVVLAEHMPGMRSAAMELHVPAGGATDPVERCGSANVLSEMVLRGAGGRDARQLTEYLDGLGLWRSSGTGTLSTRFSASGLASHVMHGLKAHADIVRRPHLHEDAFGPSVDLALQSLEGLADNPQGLAMVKLREWAWPGPFSRNPAGELDHLEKLTAEGLKDDFVARFRPDGAVLSIAGDIDQNNVRDDAERFFGDWQGPKRPVVDVTPSAGDFLFIEQDVQQTHIALAYPTPAESRRDYYLSRLAVECLSGGMSGRLFDRIRERQGLCYSIFASYASLAAVETGPSDDDDFASIFCYAGTSNERAQETLDALVRELVIMREGVTADELRRAKIGLKAGTVTSGESTSARAGALARDWQVRRRLRSLDEIVAAIDAITLDDVNAWLAANPAGPFTVVLIGPKPLDVPDDGGTRRGQGGKGPRRSDGGAGEASIDSLHTP